MPNKINYAPLGFTDQKLPSGSHICNLYISNDERTTLTQKFIEAGRENKERLFIMESPNKPHEFDEYLAKAPAYLKGTNQVQITATKENSSFEETFPLDDMLLRIEEFYRDAIQTGYNGARLIGEMSYFAKNNMTKDPFPYLQFESKLTLFLQEYPCTVLCQCDLRLFSGTEIFNILSVHPITVIRGQVFHNPFYIQAADFLRGHGEKVA